VRVNATLESAVPDARTFSGFHAAHGGDAEQHRLCVLA
jgi:hypothetical protein